MNYGVWINIKQQLDFPFFGLFLPSIFMFVFEMCFGVVGVLYYKLLFVCVNRIRCHFRYI